MKRLTRQARALWHAIQVELREYTLFLLCLLVVGPVLLAEEWRRYQARERQ